MKIKRRKGMEITSSTVSTDDIIIAENQEFFKKLPFNSKYDACVFMYGKQLKAPFSFWQTNRDIVDAITGGCGPGGFGDKFVPDKIYGLSVTAACKVHDWTFGVWNDEESFNVANELFKENMYIIIKEHGGYKWLQWLRRRRAYKYYLAVAKLGMSSYLDNHLKYIV